MTALGTETPRSGGVVSSPDPDPDPDRQLRGVLAAVLAAIGWLAVAVVGGLVLAAVAVPRLSGAETYTVLTGSMKPSLSPGAIVVVRPTDVADIAVGDVVTYQLESGEATTVTHRVVGIGAAASGERRLVTQGDANDVPDADLVRAVQVRGTVWYSIPWAGRIPALVGGEERMLLSRAAGGLLIAYALVLAVGGFRARRRSQRSDGRKASA